MRFLSRSSAEAEARIPETLISAWEDRRGLLRTTVGVISHWTEAFLTFKLGRVFIGLSESSPPTRRDGRVGSVLNCDLGNDVMHYEIILEGDNSIYFMNVAISSSEL